MGKTDYPEAAKRTKLARQARAQGFGARIPRIYAVIVNNLAIVYDKMGQYEKAEPLFKVVWKSVRPCWDRRP